MPETVIECELGCRIVLERICLEDTAEERELIELQLAFEICESKCWMDACAAL